MGNALTNIEYICLKMMANPGRSQRWYRGMLYMYRNGKFNSDSYHSYFDRSSRYREVLWWDSSTALIKDHMPWGSAIIGQTAYKSQCCELYLTDKGKKVAQRAKQKIGI